MREASKDVLNEIERNLQDAMQVARSVIINPKFVPCGGTLEMELSHRLNEYAKKIEGLQLWQFKALAASLELIQRTLTQNCEANVVCVMTELRSKYSKDEGMWYGIDGNASVKSNMKELNIWDPVAIKNSNHQ